MAMSEVLPADLAGTTGSLQTTTAARLRKVEARPKPRKALVLAIQVLLVLLLFGTWQLAGSEHWINPLFWSTPAKIWDRAAQLFAGKQIDGSTIYWAVGYTIFAAILGFVIGTTLGASIGMSLWWSRTAETVLSPFIVVFHALPKFALSPLLVLILGLGIKSEVALAVALTIVTSLFAAQGGVRSVDPDQVRLCQSLGASRRQTFVKVVVPTTIPWIVSSLRMNIGLALAGAIIGELVASNSGVGHLIAYAGSVYDVALIWVGTFVLAALAVLMYGGVSVIEKRLLMGLHAAK